MENPDAEIDPTLHTKPTPSDSADHMQSAADSPSHLHRERKSLHVHFAEPIASSIIYDDEQSPINSIPLQLRSPPPTQVTPATCGPSILKALQPWRYLQRTTFHPHVDQPSIDNPPLSAPDSQLSNVTNDSVPCACKTNIHVSDSVHSYPAADTAYLPNEGKEPANLPYILATLGRKGQQSDTIPLQSWALLFCQSPFYVKIDSF